MKTYLKKGYSKDWINQRLKSIEVRKELTNKITKAWSEKSVKEYKRFKNLKKENLRDNMTNLELILNMLAEASTTEISKSKKPKDLKENKRVAKEGGHVAGTARKEIEDQTGKKIVSPKNSRDIKQIKS